MLVLLKRLQKEEYVNFLKVFLVYKQENMNLDQMNVEIP